MVDQNRVEGFARDVGGKVQDAVGGLMGDSSTQARGKANQAVGTAQNLYGQAVDQVRDFATGQPIGALLVAIGVGVMLGLLLCRR
jgi:uncharacterized protein YjbJ (UPF0337 family)